MEKNRINHNRKRKRSIIVEGLKYETLTVVSQQ